MKASFHATIRDAAGVPWVELEAGTVRELLDKLRQKFGQAFYDIIVQGGGLREDVVILKNGRNIAHFRGLDTELAEGDDVAIFPPVSGG